MATAQNLPSSGNADSATLVTTPSRSGKYGEAYAISLFSAKAAAFALEGSYFTAYNVTDGTGIAGHPAPVQADLSLKPLLHIFNGNAAGGKSLILDLIRLRVTAVGAGATTTDFTVWTDQAGATCKTSGGTVATSVNVRSDNPNTTGAIVSFGAVVATAPASERRLDHQRVRSVVPVVEDQYVFTFGNTAPLFAAATPVSGTLILAAQVPLPPVVILPGGNFKLEMWGASQSGAHSLEYTCGWVER